MASIFNVLAEIRKRPSMYLGGDEDRVRQLQEMETLLAGYSLALQEHRASDSVENFGREFCDFLRQTRGWSTSCGFADAFRVGTPTDEEAWNLFWKLLDEFRVARSD